MKFLLTALVLASGANAFVPSSSLNKASTAMYVGEVSRDRPGQVLADDHWYYKPWGGITEETFYPQSQAGNRMCSFPPPTETVGVASGESTVPAAAVAPPLPEAAAAAPMPEMDASAAAPMPEMDASAAAPMPEMGASKVSAKV
jgi:hypothetical protein